MGSKILKYTCIVLCVLIISGFVMKYRQDVRTQQGYCTWKETKKDLLLTREQRLDLAITRFLRDQTSFDYQEIELAENNGKRTPNYLDSFKNRFTLLRYNNKEELLKENHQCCALVGVDIPSPSGDFWDWSSNPGTSVFEIKHKIRYIENNGSAKEITSAHTYFAIDNCGGIEPIFTF